MNQKAGALSPDLSKGRWDAFSKTPTASNLVICFWVKLHLEPEPTRHRCATATQPKVSPPPAGATRDGIAGGTKMEKVTGIGGLFFRAHDPKALGRWYQQHLGISLTPSSYEDSVSQQEAGPTVFAPFEETCDYFGDAHKFWMVNSRGPGSRQNGGPVTSRWNRGQMDPQSYPNGRFARLHDPEGNPIELWQPKVAEH
jgi:glyoxylase I family protein